MSQSLLRTNKYLSSKLWYIIARFSYKHTVVAFRLVMIRSTLVKGDSWEWGSGDRVSVVGKPLSITAAGATERRTTEERRKNS